MQNEQKTYYEILKVTPASTDDEIKDAYRELSKIFHPDHNPKQKQLAEKRFKQINDAFEHLKTIERRNAYDYKMKMATQDKNENSENVTTLKANNDNQGGIFSQIAEIFWPQKTNKS